MSIHHTSRRNRPKVIPIAEYTVKPWAPTPDPPRGCKIAADRGIVATEPIPDLTVGLLTHEPVALRLSMATYDALGLFPLVSEFIVFINNRCAPMGAGAVGPHALPIFLCHP